VTADSRGRMGLRMSWRNRVGIRFEEQEELSWLIRN